MSSRISQILEVLEEIWMRRPMFASIRVKAIHIVAQRLGLRPSTIADKTVRQLYPNVATTAMFDAQIARWIGGDCAALRNAVLAGAVSREDREAVERFFSGK